MKLNTIGEIVSGQGAAGVWLNNRLLVPSPAGKPAPLTDNLIVFQTAANTIGVVNRQGLVTVVDGQGASWIEAADGHWAAFLADGRSGVRTSWGLSLPAAGLLGMLPGVLFVKTNYQTGGIAAYAVGETDPRTMLWAIDVAQPAIKNNVPQFSALDALRVIWLDDAVGRIRAHGLPAPATQGAAFDPFVVDSGDQIWIGYHTEDSRFLLHPIDDAASGYLVEEGATFGTCGIAIGRTQIACSYARGPAENGDVVTKIVDLALDPRVPLEPRAHVANYLRTVPHYAIYALAGERGYGDYPDACLDLAWCGDAKAVATANALGKWVIAGASLIEAATKRALIWVASDTPTAATLQVEIDRAEPVARRLGLGLYIHHDEPAGWNGNPPARIPAGAICGVKAYRLVGESIGDWVRRTSSEILWCTSNHHRVALTVGIDDQGGKLSEAALLEVGEMFPAMVRTFGEVAIVAYFSYGRGGELADGTLIGGGLVHPKVWAWALASWNASDHRVADRVIDWSSYALERQAPAPQPPHQDPPPPAQPPKTNPAPDIPPAPPSEEPEMPATKLPARCYVVLGHNSKIAAVVPGQNHIELDYADQSCGGYQEVEITASKNNPDRVMTRFVNAGRDNAYVRINTVLLQQRKYDQAIELFDPAIHGEADAGWQHQIPVGPYLLAWGPDVNGVKGVAYVLTCIDKDKQLFR